MNFDQIMTLLGFGVTILTAFATLGWFVIREIRSVKDDNKENYHLIDKRIHGVEIMVSPYAQDIGDLKENQTSNMVNITELRATMNQVTLEQERIQRQLEALQNRHP